MAGSESGRWTETQATTRSPAAPTLESEGASLRNTKAFRVSLHAASGQTLSGAGTLKCYLWQDENARWAPNSDLDLTVPAGAASLRDWVFPDQQVMVAKGSVLYACSSVTVSGGSLVVEIEKTM